MNDIEILKRRLKEIDAQIGSIISNAQKRVDKLEAEAEKIEERIKNEH